MFSASQQQQQQPTTASQQTTGIINNNGAGAAAPRSTSQPLSSAPRYIMSAKLTSAKALSTVLSTILLKKNTRAKFVLQNSGIKVVVQHESKSFLCIAYLKKGMFQSYHFSADAPVEFELQLGDLIDCLNIYGSAAHATSVHMNFPGFERTLSLLLSEGGIGVITDCGLRTSEVNDSMDYRFGDEITAGIKVDSDVLKEAINEVEYMESSIVMSFKKVPNAEETDHNNNTTQDDEHNATGLRLYSAGSSGNIEVFLPASSPSVQQYQCSEDCAHHYVFPHFQHLGKALAQSQSATIRVNNQGVCSIQQHIRHEKDNTVHIVEYILAPELSTMGSTDMDMADDFMPASL